MQSRISKSGKQRECNWEEINKKEKTLRIREKELLRKEMVLQRKIKEYEKRANCRAKADSRAAAKLRDARKKLLFALDSRDKLQTCNTHTCKAKKYQKKSRLSRSPSKGKRKKYTPFTDIVFDFCEKLLSCPFTQHNVMKSGLDFKQCRLYSSGLPYETCRSRNYFNRDVRNLTASNCYMKSLRRTPQICIYHRGPKFDPHCMRARDLWKNVGYLLLFVTGFLFWVPLLLCLELCKCFFCSCCCDF